MLAPLMFALATAGEPAAADAPPGHTLGDTLDVRVTALGGGGGSASGSGRSLVVRPSPAIASLDVGFRYPDVRWLEVAPGLQVELLDRVGFGLLLRLRALLPGRRVRAYGLAGTACFFAPYLLLGAQLGGGLVVDVHRLVGLTLEVPMSVYFWGNDLVPGTALFKLDATGGVRVRF